MEPQASPMPSHHWRRRQEETNSLTPLGNVSHSRTQAFRRRITIGRISEWRVAGPNHSGPEWCHGAGGIGLARIGTLRQWPIDPEEHAAGPTVNDWRDELRTDIRRAVNCVEQAWPYPFDTLCCGNLGNIELLNEAARCFAGQERPNLRDEASRRMMAIITAADARGDYLWDVGDRRFNLGLFKGLAGVGYTLLRQLDRHLPNVLIWE